MTANPFDIAAAAQQELERKHDELEHAMARTAIDDASSSDSAGAAAAATVDAPLSAWTVPDAHRPIIMCEHLGYEDRAMRMKMAIDEGKLVHLHLRVDRRTLLPTWTCLTEGATVPRPLLEGTYVVHSDATNEDIESFRLKRIARPGPYGLVWELVDKDFASCGSSALQKKSGRPFRIGTFVRIEADDVDIVLASARWMCALNAPTTTASWFQAVRPTDELTMMASYSCHGHGHQCMNLSLVNITQREHTALDMELALFLQDAATGETVVADSTTIMKVQTDVCIVQGERGADNVFRFRLPQALCAKYGAAPDALGRFHLLPNSFRKNPYPAQHAPHGFVHRLRIMDMFADESAHSMHLRVESNGTEPLQLPHAKFLMNCGFSGTLSQDLHAQVGDFSVITFPRSRVFYDGELKTMQDLADQMREFKRCGGVFGSDCRLLRGDSTERVRALMFECDQLQLFTTAPGHVESTRAGCSRVVELYSVRVLRDTGCLVTMRGFDGARYNVTRLLVDGVQIPCPTMVGGMHQLNGAVFYIQRELKLSIRLIEESAAPDADALFVCEAPAAGGSRFVCDAPLSGSDMKRFVHDKVQLRDDVATDGSPVSIGTLDIERTFDPRVFYSTAIDERSQLLTGPGRRPMLLRGLSFSLGITGATLFNRTPKRANEDPNFCPAWMHITFPFSLTKQEDARRRQIPLLMTEYFDDDYNTSVVTSTNALLRAYTHDETVDDANEVIFLTIEAPTAP